MKFLKFWFPVGLYSGIIFYISSIPNLQAPLSEFWGDKVLHLMEYIPFGFLTARALIHTKDELPFQKPWLPVLGISFLYGVSDEIHQLFVAGRTVALGDMMMDSMGGLLGGWLYFKFLNSGIISGIKQHDAN